MSVDFKGKGAYKSLAAMIEHSSNWFYIKDDTVVCSDPVAVQAIIDSYTISDAVDCIVPEIRDFAGSMISARYPTYKQMNMLARQAELADIRLRMGLTAPEATEFQALEAVWNWIKSVRTTSNVHEQNMRSLPTFEALNAYDWKAGWPE